MVARAVHRWRQFLASIAICGLLAPLLTPAMPGLAAWTPEHDHLFAGGVEAPHSHPWDEREPASASSVLHFCAVHPDGQVAEAASGERTDAAESNGDSESVDVVFLFDSDMTGSVSLPPPAPALSCGGATVVSSTAAAARPASAVTLVPIPPPKSPSASAA